MIVTIIPKLGEVLKVPKVLQQIKGRIILASLGSPHPELTSEP